MKAVPSLIASSTIGIAATGLVLGKLESQESGCTVDAFNQDHDQVCTSSRPATSFTDVGSLIDCEYSQAFYQGARSVHSQISHRRPPLSCVNKLRFPRNRRPPSLLNIETASSHDSPTDEDRTRESISSRDSWIRRLSSIPTSQSQQGSTVSGSPNTDSSYTHKAHTYMRRENIPVVQSRNRLMKRIPRNKSTSGSEISNTSRHKFSLRRRPVSSHQHVFFSRESNQDPNRTSHDDRQTNPPKSDQNLESHYIWRLFFDFSSARTSMDRTSNKLGDKDSIKHRLKDSAVHKSDFVKPTLLKPDMIVSSREHFLSNNDCLKRENGLSSNEVNEYEESKEGIFASRSPPRAEPIKHPRRSISMQFSSPTAWIPLPGSLAGLRRNFEGKNLHRRASELAPDVRGNVGDSAYGKSENDNTNFEHINCQPVLAITPKITSTNDELIMTSRMRSQESYSPLPSLHRLSTFSIDLAGTNSPTLLPSLPQEYPVETESEFNFSSNETSIDNIIPAYTTNGYPVEAPNLIDTNFSHKPTTEITDRASTLIGSDFDTKGILWCDEDDTDFQSDTVFDSMRSGATGSTQSPKLPLQCVFDETPPFMDYHLYMKLEEYNIPSSDEFPIERPTISRDKIGISPSKIDFSMSREEHLIATASTNQALCLEDFSPPILLPPLPNYKDDSPSFQEVDKDWTWSETHNELQRRSSQSTSSCFIIENRISTDLADHNKVGVQGTYHPERPKTNVFDWSEPSQLDKFDVNGNSQRPRTAHLEQIINCRSSRALGRRGPSALHVRSQSVPVVPDMDTCKVTSKFGTWGLGSKAISEDWDGDFEFDSADSINQVVGVCSKDRQRGVQVPEAIKANQENIADHVGQIREVCLLVEDLKSLRALGKEQGLLQGEFQPLWLQAEGIIALAAPEEEDEKQEPHLNTLNKTNHRPPLSMHNNQHRILRTELRSGYGICQNSRTLPSTGSIRMNNYSTPLNDLHGPSKSLTHHVHAKSSTEVARKVMESMHQQRSISDPTILNFAGDSGSKMPFDTTSLKDLVSRATILSRALSQVVRAADSFESSSEIRQQESCPAFTRVFTDPLVVPPKIPFCRQGDTNSSSSSSVNLSQRMNMMAAV